MAAIAFIGLGNMGGPMAGNLVKAGHTVMGFDIVGANLEAAKARGVSPASDAASAVRSADVVVTMLPAGRHVMSVYEETIATAARKGSLAIDCSTIDVGSARSAHEIAARAGLASVDAPVSGGVTGAEAATLALMVGGAEAAFASAQPILSAMGRKVIHCGGPGAGQAAKICNNMVLGISMVGLCEAFVLAEKLGLSHQALFEVVSGSSGQCWSLTNYCPVPGPVPASPANRGYQPGFAAALMVKDLTLAQEAAAATGAVTPLGAEAAQLFRLFAGNGNAGKDFSGIIEFLRGKAAQG